MKPSTLSARIKENNSTKKDVDAITERLNSSLKLSDEPDSKSEPLEIGDDDAGEEDWEKLADKELQSPVEAVKTPVAQSDNTTILELYDFDPRIQMHQLVKEFTKIVDPTGTMFFRPKMVNQSIMLTFTNPKHGMDLFYVINSSYGGVVQLLMYHSSRSSWQTSSFRWCSDVSFLIDKFYASCTSQSIADTYYISCIKTLDN
jgi:hypothetical protein